MGIRHRQRVTTAKIQASSLPGILPAFDGTPKLPILDAREAGYIRILFRGLRERKRKLEHLTLFSHAAPDHVTSDKRGRRRWNK